jgi:hypothetical protein
MSIEARVLKEEMQEGSPLFTFHAGGSELRLCFFRDSRRLEFTFFRKRAWHSILTSGFPSSRTFKKEGQRTQALMPKFSTGPSVLTYLDKRDTYRSL